MSNWYDSIYGFVSVLRNDALPICSLKRTHSGLYAKNIQDYIKHGIIEKAGKNKDNEDTYRLTSLGKKFFRQEIGIDELIALCQE